jgi:hypothetical protein
MRVTVVLPEKIVAVTGDRRAGHGGAPHSPICRSICSTQSTYSSVSGDEDVKYAASPLIVNQRVGTAASTPYVRIAGYVRLTTIDGEPAVITSMFGR